eukprot:Phypoly_transcript_03680.p1 GENE.Phypoly_transcript_03680~~Phypoly_transcript_03680.p1  ORF type:complete len:673 (+),score=78.96 Phypoly_transcript_03680:66-2021(+)
MENGGSTEDVVPLLWDIAEEAFSSNQILAGLRCLEAIVQGKARAAHKGSRVLPMQEALTHLRIAEILLEHTYNIEEAKSHLERTVMLLQNVHNAGEYWFKANAHLAYIHEQAKDTSLVKNILKQALDGAISSPEWRYYFLLRLADVYSHENNINDARTFLETGLKLAEVNGSKKYQNLFYLALFQISLLTWDLPTSSDIKHYLDDVIPNTADVGNGDLVLIQHQQYYYFLLSTVQNLRMGDMENLPTILSSLKDTHKTYHNKTINTNNTPDANTANLSNMDTINNNIANSNTNNSNNMLNFPATTPINNNTPNNNTNTFNNYNSTNNNNNNNITNINNNNNIPNTNNKKSSIPFSYLDNEVVMTVLLNLILSIASRANNTLQSIASAEAGLSSVEVAMQSGKLTECQFCSVLRLKFYLHENLFYIKLTQNHFNSALLQIKVCHQIYMNHKYPDDLIGGIGGFECIIHSMCCLMAHACGSFDLAINHARLALQKAKQEYVQFVCMLYMLLLYLQIGEINTVERLISQYSQRWQLHPQRVVKVLSTFVEGIVLRIQGADDVARKKFSTSLSLGREIKNNQATAQILNEIAKMFLKNVHDRGSFTQNGQPDTIALDLVKRTQDTAESAYKLAHHMGDIGTQLVSLKALQGLSFS